MNQILYKYYIAVETLTPVHIGSGRELMGNFEYLFFKKDRKIALIDEHKVLNLIGTDQIDKWVSIIDQGGNLLHYLLQRTRNLQAKDVSQRIISVPDQGPEQGKHAQTILEQLHNGTGKPMLPGSSLKGALRTAVFTGLLLEYKAPGRLLQETYKKKWDRKKNREIYTFKDKELQKKLLGENANQDTFRMLRTGDIHFTQTEAFPTLTVNKKYNGWMMDSKISPYLECIPSGQKSICELSIIKNRNILDSLANIPFKTWEELCAIVNDHTRRLLKDELAFWESEHNPPLTATYLEHLQKLLKQIPEDHEACLLRIGYGSGVNFMIGGWQSELMDDDLYEHWRDSFYKS
jgi:CRISPR-associated protein Csm5